MNLSTLIQRHRTSGAKLTSIAVAVALVGQLTLGALVQAAVHVPNPSADLDQCGNGPTATPVPCTGSNWQNGNLNSNNSHYAEGQSAPYRVVMSNLPTTGTLSLVIEYDIMNSSKHAIDYLTSFDRTEATADPCSGVTGCSLSGTAAIPAPSTAGSPVSGQPATSFNALPSGERAISLYNAAIAGTGVTYVSQGSLTAAQSSTQVQIQFTASQSTVVFAWGGHIGAASDWGSGNSAGGISGSPYHMRLVSLTGANLGNQDRSLSADAVTAATLPGTLNVIKHVINDDGGTSVASDFTMNVTGTNVSTSSFPGSETGTSVTLDAGSYSVAEGTASGYDVTYSADCTGTIASGETKTCTVTNDDIAPPPPPPSPGTLTIIKHVINDDSGTAVASDFTLNVSGTNVSTPSFSGSETGTDVTLDAGTYSVAEDAASGYVASYSTDCTGTIAAGETKTCTVTNDDIAPPPPPPPNPGTLIVIKHVVNDDGGTAAASAFTLNVAGTSVSQPSFNGSESGTSVTLAAGEYAVTEDAATGYAATYSADCSGTIAADETKTCTVTNDDIAPPAPNPGTLTVIKHVINDNGGTAVAADFTMNVTGTNVSNASFPGSEDGTNVTLDAGEYSVNESAASGYAVSYSEGCSGTMSADGSATCTVTNDDIAPPPNEGPSNGTLTVVKVVINDDSGTKQVSDFPLFVGQTQVTSGQANSFEPGSYTVSETSDAGYVASFSGDCDASGIVSLESGDEKTCTITNDDVRQTDGGGGNPSTGLLIVVTNVINDDGGSALPAHFLMTVTSGSPSVFAGQGTPGMSLSTLPGAYSVDGSNDPGYAKSAGPNCTGTLSANQTVTCVITYDDLPAAGGEPTPPTPPETPTPEVLGATDSATGPVPMVLGATDEDLPVTGMPAWALIAFLLPAAPFLRRKRA